MCSSDLFPGLTKPDPSYHGVVWSDALGPAAYIGRIRTVLLRNTGAALSPFNAFLILQGLETLPLRIERQSANALAIAKHLKAHPDVAWVNYPGLEDDAYHANAVKILDQGKGFGGILSFGVKGGRDQGRTFIESLEIFTQIGRAHV